MILDELKIEWPGKNKRARKVVKRSNHRVTGKYPSWKMGRMIHWESTLERDAFMLMDVDSTIIEFYEQPAKIKYLLAGKSHTHFPDTLVVTSTGSCFIEIKEKQESLKDEVQARSLLLSKILPSQGYSYLVLTEQDIRKNPRLANARTLLRYGRTKPDPLTMEAIRRDYFSDGKCYLGDVISSQNGHFSSICHMILDGLLAIDINQDWEAHTPITVNCQEVR